VEMGGRIAKEDEEIRKRQEEKPSISQKGLKEMSEDVGESFSEIWRSGLGLNKKGKPERISVCDGRLRFFCFLGGGGDRGHPSLKENKGNIRK